MLYNHYIRPKDLKIKRNLLIPNRGNIFDHFYKYTQYGSWTQWSAGITKVTIDDGTKVFLDRVHCRLVLRKTTDWYSIMPYIDYP